MLCVDTDQSSGEPENDRGRRVLYLLESDRADAAGGTGIHRGNVIGDGFAVLLDFLNQGFLQEEAGKPFGGACLLGGKHQGVSHGDTGAVQKHMASGNHGENENKKESEKGIQNIVRLNEYSGMNFYTNGHNDS